MKKLDNPTLISKLDASNMLGLISGLPAQCREAYSIGSKADITKLPREIHNIVFAGLGGSAIGADIIKAYLQNELKVPVAVSRNYTLPGFVGKGTLLFCSSYSGNTEETLSSFESGLKKGAHIITMGSGGALQELSKANGFKHIKVPSGFPPRAALGYMSLAVLAALVKMDIIENKEKEIDKLYSSLVKLRDEEIGARVVCGKNIAKKLAESLLGKYCIIYGTSDATEAVSLRWRGQFAENSKSLSSSHVLPEMNHNEIVGWVFPKDKLKGFKVVMLRDKSDHERTRKRMDISKTIIKESGAEVLELERKEKTLLERVFSLIFIGDYTSFYLAILNNIDPTPVKKVDYLKAQLAKM